MNRSVKLGGLFAAIMLAFSGASMATEMANPYVQSNAQTLKSGSGLCVRTGYWNQEAAQASKDGCACDAAVLSCQEAAPVKEEPKAEQVTLSADMLFAYNKARLKPEGQAALDDLVSRIAGVDVELILSAGYADRIGSDKFNLKLSQARANAVKAYLVSKGIDESLIRAEGKGEADPVVNCPNPWREGKIKNFKQLVECLAPNRRAVVEVTGTRPAE